MAFSPYIFLPSLSFHKKQDNFIWSQVIDCGFTVKTDRGSLDWEDLRFYFWDVIFPWDTKSLKFMISLALIKHIFPVLEHCSWLRLDMQKYSVSGSAWVQICYLKEGRHQLAAGWVTRGGKWLRPELALPCLVMILLMELQVYRILWFASL